MNANMSGMFVGLEIITIGHSGIYATREVKLLEAHGIELTDH
jgi:hypothetical protein